MFCIIFHSKQEQHTHQLFHFAFRQGQLTAFKKKKSGGGSSFLPHPHATPILNYDSTESSSIITTMAKHLISNSLAHYDEKWKTSTDRSKEVLTFTTSCP
jgi:hypothetical protein